VQSSQLYRDQGARGDYKTRDYSAHDVIYCINIIKELENQIFVDVAQEGVNHGRSCVM
jgi:hypothetical protein